MKTILFSFIFCLITVCLTAQPGTLDSSFGVNGEVISNFQNDYALAYDAAIEKNNSIIVTGYGYISPFNDTVGILLLNYLQDGSLNSNFGDSGRIIYNFPGYIFSNGKAVYIQPDGKIIIAGFGTKNDSDPEEGDLILLRINPDGLLDSTFGENGLVSKNFGKPPKINAIQMQPDGKILVGGGMSGDFFLTRYNANGTIDENFGNEGYVLTSFSQGVAAMNSIAIEPNGKILAAGVTQFESAFAQYTMDGSLDEKYNTTFNVESSYINSIAIEDDGSFIVTGLGGRLFRGGTVVAKFKSIGVVDSGFGTNGNVFFHFGTAVSVYLQADSKIIVAGTGSDTDTSKFMALRLLANGIFDSSFGANGIAFANFGYSYVPVVFKGFFDNTGKIILTGNADGGQYIGHTILLARFNNNISKKQIIINVIKHYISTHNNSDAKTLNNNITLYPNPANDILTINNLDAKNNYELSIINNSGNVVATKQVNNISSYQFNIQNLSGGVYYVNVVADNKLMATLKFVKQ